METDHTCTTVTTIITINTTINSSNNSRNNSSYVPYIVWRHLKRQGAMFTLNLPGVHLGSATISHQVLTPIMVVVYEMFDGSHWPVSDM